MATLVLSAAGMAIGGSVGGTVLGLSAAAVGRAAGAAVGRAIDQRILGSGSEPVESGRVDRFRLTGAGEGAAIARVHGRVRLGGHVIWASNFREDVTRTGGGKGAPQRPRVDSYSYSVSLAIALCEGEITHVGRVWADGVEIDRQSVDLRVYPGSEAQQPDPLITAIEGADAAPAYRGTAYVVIEELDLGPYGNRVPQFSFEVMRAAQPGDPEPEDMTQIVRGVAMIPGTGEYALAATPLSRRAGVAERQLVNMNTPGGQADLLQSLDALEGELPACRSVSLVVSWFGDDLRCGRCGLYPRSESATGDADAMPWQVSGLGRAQVGRVAAENGRAVYGGTPADASVIEAITEMRARGLGTVFYPFILMEQLDGNGRVDPWTGAADQPRLPWRGRITLDVAPVRDGSPDGTAAAEAAVAAFFGTAAPEDFAQGDGTVTYSGPEEWSYRRMILHYAHLCVMAGGVDTFLIGSEMRGLTTIRGVGGSYPAVTALVQLVQDVRAILGPDCEISYAADWSEYHGHQPGGATKRFHLDPLWSDPEVAFVGIDNYMPIADWRDGTDHADAAAGSIHNLDYLTANVAGGEGFDWYYPDDEARAQQRRVPITDPDGEPWVWRFKDIAGWWGNLHHDRIEGARSATPTAWRPGLKPVRFTEFGCAAVDKGANAPNRFLDPKSSESGLPFGSNGRRDDQMQLNYLRAVSRHFSTPEGNPASPLDGRAMVDMERSHVWAWDARPYPWFPGNRALWADGDNYGRGHWITGRGTSRPLSAVVREICAAAGVRDIATDRLFGLVRGYLVDGVQSPRAALQPLALAYGFDAIERDGVLHFVSRDGQPVLDLDDGALVLPPDDTPVLEQSRASAPEIAGRVRLGFVETDGSYEIRTVEATLADDEEASVEGSELPLVLTGGEASGIARRWLAEARLARDSLRFALPPSRSEIGAGDVVRLKGADWRIDRVERTEALQIEALRVDRAPYHAEPLEEARAFLPGFVAPAPVEALFMDLPLMTGDEVAHAPHVAVAGQPWPGPVALYASPYDSGYELDRVLDRPATIGLTETALEAAPPGLWDRGGPLRVRLAQGALSSASTEAVLAGANLAAIGAGDGTRWELFQFQRAEVVGQGVYELDLRLRGQFGSDGDIPDVWPAGSWVVMLDGTAQQIGLPSNARGLDRHLRWGPASRALGDPSYDYRVARFDGIGLRPYSVCHLGTRMDGGDVIVDWTRRTRIDGDSWDGAEVPLGEAREDYAVRVMDDGRIVRTETVTEPQWRYDQFLRLLDGTGPGTVVEVAQLSDRFGPGPWRGVPLPLAV